jgi:hypothetical protein
LSYHPLRELQCGQEEPLWRGWVELRPWRVAMEPGLASGLEVPSVARVVLPAEEQLAAARQALVLVRAPGYSPEPEWVGPQLELVQLETAEAVWVTLG